MNKHFSRGVPLNSNGRTDRRTTEFPWLPKLWKNAVAVAGYGKWWFALLDDNNSLQPVASTAAVAQARIIISLAADESRWDNNDGRVTQTDFVRPIITGKFYFYR